MKKILLYLILFGLLSVGSTTSAQFAVPWYQGGVDNENYNSGDIIYFSSSSPPGFRRLTTGTDAQVLTMYQNYPAWRPATGGTGGGSNTWDWIVNGDTMYSTSTALYVGIGTTTPSTYGLTIDDSTGVLIYDPSNAALTIGTPSNNAYLSYNGTNFEFASGGGLEFAGGNAGLPEYYSFGGYLYINSSGYVGIATTTPEYPLTVVGNMYVYQGDVNLQAGERVTFDWDGSQNSTISYTEGPGLEIASNGNIYLYAWSEFDLVVDIDNGYVGIATSTPTSLLSIGTISGKQFLINDLGYATGNLLGRASTTNQISTLTNTKWCSTDGSVITCTEDAPAGSGDITSVGTCLDGACDNFTLNELTITYGLTAATSTLSATSTALGLVLTGTATSTIAGSLDINGNLNVAGGITAGLFVGPLTGTASLATALANNPTDCTNQFANAIGANGNLTCASVADAYVDFTALTLADFTNDANFWTTTSASSYLNATTSMTVDIVGNVTGNLTGTASLATALAANPTNCDAGNYPLGIDASGNVESCTVAGTGGGSNTWDWIVSGTNMYSTSTATKIGISTTTPRYTLDVWGDMIIGTTTAGTTSNYPTLYVKSGNGWEVDIGTTTPIFPRLFGIGTSTDYFTIDRTGGTRITSTTISNSLSIPSSADPSITFGGQIAINTTPASTSVRFYNGSAEVGLFPQFEKSFFIASTTDDENNNSFDTATTTFTLWNPARRVTLNGLYAKTDTGNVSVACGDGTNWTESIRASSTGVEDDGSMINNTFTIREEFQCKVGSVASTASKVTVTAEFQYASD